MKKIILTFSLTSPASLNDKDFGFVEKCRTMSIIEQDKYLLQWDFATVGAEHESFFTVTQETDDTGVRCEVRLSVNELLKFVDYTLQHIENEHNQSVEKNSHRCR